jgi:hypothetical protein
MAQVDAIFVKKIHLSIGRKLSQNVKNLKTRKGTRRIVFEQRPISRQNEKRKTNHQNLVVMSLRFLKDYSDIPKPKFLRQKRILLALLACATKTICFINSLLI